MSLLVFAFATLFGVFGWAYTSELVGDLCINGKPEPSPFPQVRDMVGMLMAITVMVAIAWLLSTGEVPPPPSFSLPAWLLPPVTPIA